MRILVLTTDGDGFSLAYALKRSGDEVAFYSSNRLGVAMSGLLDRVSTLKEGLEWADLVIPDMVGMGGLQKRVEKSGKPALGLSMVADAMELDRGKQMDLLQRVGIPRPPTYHFTDPTEALQVLGFFTDPGYVVKPSGNLNTAKTMVCRTPETYEWALEQFAADQELIVQKIVEGVEVSTEGWFNGREWLHFNHTFEEKRFLYGGLGQNTGCMGNVVLQARPNALTAELQRLTPFLKAANYRGPIDLNCIVNRDGIHALELTPRLGYDAIEALWAMSKNLSQFMLGVAEGRDEILSLHSSVGAAVRLSLPPYPMSEPTPDDAGRPIKAPLNDSILWSDAYLQGGKLYWSGVDGVLAKVVGAGEDILEAKQEAYKAVDAVYAMDLQYRTDIGARVHNDLTALRTWGIEV